MSWVLEGVSGRSNPLRELARNMNLLHDIHDTEGFHRCVRVVGRVCVEYFIQVCVGYVYQQLLLRDGVGVANQKLSFLNNLSSLSERMFYLNKYYRIMLMWDYNSFGNLLTLKDEGNLGAHAYSG